MLVLSRKKGQSIIINGDIEIVITAVEGEQVKIGISAPKEYNILRKEVVDDVRSTNRNSIMSKDEMVKLKDWFKSTEKNQ
ncbi:carbon storage regulator [Paenibacillus sp. GCM10023252]|uniref:carbon storage regulator n=1 Tax=Paenibacillus sp. GCM10023252 TaxID=3252649 RepID=UPI00360B2A1A